MGLGLAQRRTCRVPKPASRARGAGQATALFSLLSPAQGTIQRRPVLPPPAWAPSLFRPGPGWVGQWSVLAADKIPLCRCNKLAVWLKKGENIFYFFPVVWWGMNLRKELSSLSVRVTYSWSFLLSHSSYLKIVFAFFSHLVLLVLLMKKPYYLKIWEKNFSASNGRKKNGRPWKGRWGPYIMKIFVKMV